MIGLEQSDSSEVPAVLICMQREETLREVMSTHLLALDPPALAGHIAPVEITGVIGDTNE